MGCVGGTSITPLLVVETDTSLGLTDQPGQPKFQVQKEKNS